MERWRISFLLHGCSGAYGGAANDCRVVMIMVMIKALGRWAKLKAWKVVGLQ
ncbi:MAG: hypothetical protein AAF986_10045 [Pseudomonadota bacterium]